MMAAAIGQSECYEAGPRLIYVLYSKGYPNHHPDVDNIKRTILDIRNNDAIEEFPFENEDSFSKELNKVQVRFRRQSASSGFRSILLFVLSHGGVGDILQGGIDVKCVLLKGMSKKEFSARGENPVICFISSCRGDSDNMANLSRTEDNPSTLANPHGVLEPTPLCHNVRHVFIVMGTVEDCESPFHDQAGSFLVYRLCKHWSRGFELGETLRKMRQDDPGCPYFGATFALPCTSHDTLLYVYRTES